MRLDSCNHELFRGLGGKTMRSEKKMGWSTKTKKIGMLLIVWTILLVSFVVHPKQTYAEGVDLDNAQSISLGTTLNGAITENERAQVYLFQLSSAGRVTFDMESYMKYYSIIIYDMSGDCIWYTDHNTWNENLKYIKNTHTADLTAGSYYLRVTGYYYYDYRNSYDSTGTYMLAVSFASAGETMSEPNNEFSQASSLDLNGTVTGQIADNDNNDIYKFSLGKSGRIALNVTSYMQYYSVVIYDESGELLWYTDHNTWNENLAYRSDEYNLDFSAGTYYMRVNGYYYYDYRNSYASTGTYTIQLSDLPSVREASVSKIKTQTYKGTSIEPKIKVTYKGTTLRQGRDYTVSYSNNYNVGKATVVISGIGKYTGEKSTSFVIVPAALSISNAKNTGKGKAYLAWSCDYNATGYEVYESTKKSGKYTFRYSTSENSYNAVNMYKLKKGKTYYYKVRSYILIDGKKYYGKFSKVKSIKIKK
jgi:hypothetical protein